MDPSKDYGAGAAQDALNTGRSAVNSFDPTGAANTQRNNSGTLFNTQMGQTNDYINKYAQGVAANPTVTALYNQGNEQFHVPQLANTANYLQNQVTNTIPDAYQGARGFDIGNTAVQNGVAQKLGYLMPQANAAQNNLNTAQTLAGQYVQAGQAQNAQNLLPIQAEAPFLQQAQAAQATGWNQANHDELTGLIQKMQSGIQLSQAEMERANQLAAQETSYQNALTSAATSKYTANLANQYQKVGPSDSLVNTFTNGIINPGQLAGRNGGTYQLR